MANNNYRQGADAERGLANRLTDEGYLCMRSAGSGAAQRAQPDLTAINENVILLLECKTYQDGSRTIPLADERAQLDEVRGMIEGKSLASGNRRETERLVCMKKPSADAWRYVKAIGSTVTPNEIDQRLYEILLDYKS